MSLFASLGNGGDIWGSSFDFSSPLKDLLESESFTLTDLLQQDELLQEVKSLNSQLVDFITKPEELEELLRHLVEADDDGSVMTAGIDVQEADADEDAQPDEDPLSESVVIVDSAEVPSPSATLDADADPDNSNPEDQQDPDSSNTTSPPPTPNLDESGSSNDDSAPPPPSIVIPESTNQAIRYPYLACEVICCDVSQIIDAIVESQSSSPTSLLDLIFSIIEKPPPLPPRIAGYFEKVVTALFRRRPTALSSYINSRGFPLFEMFLNHLSNFSVMQLVKRLIMPKPSPDSEEETWQMGRDDSLDKMTCSWGSDVKYVKKIVEKMSGTRDVEFAVNAGELLSGVVQQCSLNHETLLAMTGGADYGEGMLRMIVDMALPKNVEEENMSRTESTATAGLDVLEALLLQLGGYGCVSPIPEGEEKNAGEMTLASPIPISEVIREEGILKRIEEHLESDVAKGWRLTNQDGKVVGVLGATRLKIVRVVEALILLASPEVDSLLSTSKVFSTCLDLFFEFESCSLLHQSVANLLVHIIEGGAGRVPLQKVLLTENELLTRLLRCFEDNERHLKAGGKGRKGYMGHVIIVSQAIVHACTDEDESDPDANGEITDVNVKESEFFTLVEACQDYEKWQDFILSTLATETAIQSTPLGGYNSPSRQENLSDDIDFGLDSNDMDIAANMIASLNLAATGGKQGMKLGMGGLTFDAMNLGLGGEDDGEDSDEEEEGNTYYDDIIKGVNGNSQDIFEGNEDTVEVLDDSSDEEEEGGGRGDNDSPPVQNLFSANFGGQEEGQGGGQMQRRPTPAPTVWAAFGDPSSQDPNAVVVEPFAAFGDDTQGSQQPTIPPIERKGSAPVPAPAGGVKNAWGDEDDEDEDDPFGDLAASSKSARDDFFG
ncbi:hypothetical protein TrST_g10743 [Triparma strigata]|uniref:SIT4 phosphatase-associated family protein n=1 Tax=Triparma strigata TaxID=1606541 RepID=A0A9W7EZC8_9STRA|nr:hypothetical protein TrST_g10743 [Triparma strigata]